MTRSEHRDTLPFDPEIERTLGRLEKQAAEHSAQPSAAETHQHSAAETTPLQPPNFINILPPIISPK